MKITIAIPTIAGRSKYLIGALQTCITQNYGNLEIIVSDNSGGEAFDIIKEFGDDRIRYIQPDKYLPMSAHWDFLLPHCTGDLVTIIGDDDGLMPGALQRVSEIVRIYGLKPVQHALIQYNWPDFPGIGGGNMFYCIHPPGRKISIQRSKDFLTSLCQADARYIDGPMVYHNFIPRDILDRLLIGKSAFHRSSPDLYSAISIAAHTNEFVNTQEVLTIAGVSARSNGASVRDGREDSKRFIAEMKIADYRSRYRTITVQLQILDSILEVSERYNLPELKDWINYGEQFCGAANECLDMPRSRAVHQLLLVTWEAARTGNLPYLFRNRGGMLMEKLSEYFQNSKQHLKAPMSEEYCLASKFPAPLEVRDIYTASIYLKRLLTESRSQ